VSLRNHIPNAITSCNLLSGVVGIIFALGGRLDIAFYLMLAAGLFDFLDGFAARLLNSSCNIGRELDSLADVISFGVLPSIMLFVLALSEITPIWAYSLNDAAAVSVSALNSAEAVSAATVSSAAGSLSGGGTLDVLQSLKAGWPLKSLLCLLPLLLGLFSGIRLARFNVDERQHDSFLGLPTPSSAIICGSIAAYCYFRPDSWLIGLCGSYWFIPALAILLSVLLLSEIPFFSFKSGSSQACTSETGQANAGPASADQACTCSLAQTTNSMKRTAFICISVIAIIIVPVLGWHWTAIPLLIFTVYILSNLIFAVFHI
jgi:CDP-diacylglycerol--serine O-phosphatidyltransferase